MQRADAPPDRVPETTPPRLMLQMAQWSAITSESGGCMPAPCHSVTSDNFRLTRSGEEPSLMKLATVWVTFEPARGHTQQLTEVVMQTTETRTGRSVGRVTP